MNNHNTYLLNENGIEYHVLEFTFSEKNDEKYLKKFISKYEYAITIDSDYLKSHKSYYKNSKLHNIYGAAEIYSIKDTNRIFQQYYYLEDIVLTKSEWVIKIRKKKIENLNLYQD